MHSLIERLRKRTLSQQSSKSAQATTAAASSSPMHPTSVSPLSTSRSEPLLVDRRIIEDLPALLGALERGGDHSSQDQRGVLIPLRPRKRSGLAGLVLNRRENVLHPETPGHQSFEKENDKPSSERSAEPSRWKGKGRASARSSLRNLSAVSSPWSTFGRYHARPKATSYGIYPSSGSQSRGGTSIAVYGSSSGNTGGGFTNSDLPSTSSVSEPQGAVQHIPASYAQSHLSHASDAAVNSPHTFGERSLSDGGARSPSPCLKSSSMVELADSIASTSSSMYVTAGNGGPSSSGSDTDPNLSRNERLSHNAWSGSTTADYPSQLVTQRRTNEGIVSSAKSEYHANERANEEEGKTNYVSDPESGPWHGGVGDRRLLLSASAEPHAQRVSRAKAVEPCSPSRFIPSPSPFPVSPTLLDAENRSNGVSDNLSRSSSYTTHSSAQRGDSWMAEPRDATNTLNSRKAVDTRDSLKRGSSTASRTGSHIKARSRRSSQLSEPSTPTVSSSKENGGAGPSSTAFPTLSPSPTPVRVPRTPRTASEPGLRSVSEKSVLETPMNTKGKRKADEVDITPPDQRAGHHATFVLPEGGHRSHHASEISRAPSSYHGRKRARLSTTSPSASPSQSRPASVSRHPTDSWPSRSVNPSSLQRAASKTASMRSGARSESMIGATNRNSERRRSLSEISIPISALVTPHAPSMSVRSSMYHMRDPRKPPRVHPTHWHLELSTPDHDGSPVQAWLFFLGFIFFPLWYIASFWRIPKTRQVGGTDTEKAVTLDDPQVEHDARSWRLRCRVMSVVSLFTYIPFIILLAIFVPRS